VLDKQAGHAPWPNLTEPGHCSGTCSLPLVPDPAFDTIGPERLHSSFQVPLPQRLGRYLQYLAYRHGRYAFTPHKLSLPLPIGSGAAAVCGNTRRGICAVAPAPHLRGIQSPDTYPTPFAQLAPQLFVLATGSKMLMSISASECIVLLPQNHAVWILDP
jgi:hypothetical protein